MIDVRAGANLAERRALLPNAVEQRLALVAQRVAPARLLEAAQQRLVIGLEEEHVVVDAAVVERLELPGELSEEPVCAHVTHDREAADAAPGEFRELHELRNEAWRKVVDAEEAEVLEGVDRLGATGTGHAGDDDDLRCADRGLRARSRAAADRS